MGLKWNHVSSLIVVYSGAAGVNFSYVAFSCRVALAYVGLWRCAGGIWRAWLWLALGVAVSSLFGSSSRVDLLRF